MTRPKGVAVIAGFLFAATAIAVVVGFALLFPARLVEWLAQFNRPGMEAFQLIGRWAGLLLLGVGVATLAAAIGLLRGRKWAWWMAVALFAINGCGDVVSFIITRDVLRSGSGILICAAFLYLLQRSKWVRKQNGIVD